MKFGPKFLLTFLQTLFFFLFFSFLFFSFLLSSILGTEVRIGMTSLSYVIVMVICHEIAIEGRCYIACITYVDLMSYASPPVQKQCSRSGTTSESYKPTFHGGHLSRNMSYGGAATIQVFRPPRRRYSYSTQSSMTELLLSVSQH